MKLINPRVTFLPNWHKGKGMKLTAFVLALMVWKLEQMKKDSESSRSSVISAIFSILGSICLALAIFIRPMDGFWIGFLALISLAMYVIAFSAAGISSIQEQREVPFADIKPEQDGDFIKDAEVESLPGGAVKISTREGPIFLVKKTADNVYWTQQVDVEGLYIGPPVQGNRKEVVEYIKYIVYLVSQPQV